MAHAGISVAWYAALEQGHDVHPSAYALNAVARALNLDLSEHTHLFHLARLSPHAAARPEREQANAPRAAALEPDARKPDGTPDDLRRLLDGIEAAPAVAVDRYWDVLGRNRALTALLPGLAPVRTSAAEPPRNVVRTVLLQQEAHVWGDLWERVARTAVGGLRASLANVWASTPDDPQAHALVSELTRSSPTFAAWWARYDVWRADRAMPATVIHPQAGLLAVRWILLDVRSAPGATVITCVPSDDVSADRLRRLVTTAV